MIDDPFGEFERANALAIARAEAADNAARMRKEQRQRDRESAQAKAELESTIPMVIEALAIMALNVRRGVHSSPEIVDAVDTLKTFLREVKAWRRLEYGHND